MKKFVYKTALWSALIVLSSCTSKKSSSTKTPAKKPTVANTIPNNTNVPPVGIPDGNTTGIPPVVVVPPAAVVVPPAVIVPVVPAKIQANIDSLTTLDDMCQKGLQKSLTLDLASQQYSPDKALFLAAVSDAVYRRQNNSYQNIFTSFGFEVVQVISDIQSGGDAIYSVHKTNNYIDAVLIGWAGSSQITDFLNDTNAYEMSAAPFQGKIHSGVYSGFGGTITPIMQQLDTTVAQYPNVPILITGHSLGGAHSVLLAEYLALLNTQQQRYNVNAVYTLGQPRVGDNIFNNSFSSHFPNNQTEQRYVRMYNQQDPIPHAFPVYNAQNTLKSITHVYTKNNTVLTIANIAYNIFCLFSNDNCDVASPWGKVSNWANQANYGYGHPDATALQFKYNNNNVFYPQVGQYSSNADQNYDQQYWQNFVDNSQGAVFGSQDYLNNHSIQGKNGYVCHALDYYQNYPNYQQQY